MAPLPPSRRTILIVALDALMLGAAAAIFLVIQNIGAAINAPAPPAGTMPPHPHPVGHTNSVLLHVLIALPVIISAARWLGAVFRRLGQPPVMGEVVAGLLLGPSLLGRLWPAGAAFLLPDAIAPHLQIIAQIGVILFMFLVGLELNAQRLRHDTPATIAISHAGIIFPFVLGAALALLLYPRLSSSAVPFPIFALFMGVSMSVTAFPVLVRILTDRGLQTTPLGNLALTCAAVADVSAWCLLAFVVSIARAQALDALTTLGLVVLFGLFMAFVARAMLKTLARRANAAQLTQGALALVIVMLLISAMATEAVGIHALFGSFVVGAIIAHDSIIATELRRRLHDVVIVLFLPAFFAYTGMRTQIGLLTGADEWLLCALIIVVACVGKFGGTAVAARLTGVPWRGAAALGVLMNTRGLMELIVLNIGLDRGILSPVLFTMFVIMAVVTTLLTSPLLQLLTRRNGNAAALIPDSTPTGS